MKNKMNIKMGSSWIALLVLFFLSVGIDAGAQSHIYTIFGTTAEQSYAVGPDACPAPPECNTSGGVVAPETQCAGLDFGASGAVIGGGVTFDLTFEDCRESCDVVYPPASVAINVSVGWAFIDNSVPNPQVEVFLNGNSLGISTLSSFQSCADPGVQILTVCSNPQFYNVGGLNTITLTLLPSGTDPVLNMNGFLTARMNPAWGDAVAQVTARYCKDICVDFSQVSNPYALTPADVESMLPPGAVPGSGSLVLDPTGPNPGTIQLDPFRCDQLPKCLEVRYTNQSSCDPGGRPSICDVKVVASMPPLPICLSRDITLQVDGSGCVTINPDMIDNGSNAGCGTNFDLTGKFLDRIEFCCDDLGANVVTLTVANISGTTSCQAIVTIEDNIAPRFFCPASRTDVLAGGSCGAFPTGAVPRVIENCGNFTIDTLAFPSTFLSVDCTTGMTPSATYSFVAIDDAGNSSAPCTFSLTYEVPESTPYLKCNDRVNLSVNLDCALAVDTDGDGILDSWAGFTPDMFLEGSDYGCYDCYTMAFEIVYTPANVLAEAIVTVTDPATGNSCWSEVLIEDGQDPFIIDDDADDFNTVCGPCSNPNNRVEGHPDFDPSCVYNCAELEIIRFGCGDEGDGLYDDIIPSDAGDFLGDFVDDNCQDPESFVASFLDSYTGLTNHDGCPEDDVLMTRTWTVNFPRKDGTVGTLQCERFYRFTKFEIFDANNDPIILQPGQRFNDDGQLEWIPMPDAIVMPIELVEINTCGVGTSPEEISAFFNTQIENSFNGPTPDEGDTPCVLEDGEGIPYAYPHYYLPGDGIVGDTFPQPIDNEVCTIVVDYWDTDLGACAPGCSGNMKTLRTWTILDWCDANYFEFNQTIKVSDKTTPTFEVRPIVASVDPWKCKADVHIPAPKNLFDNCDSDLTYSIGFVEGALTVSGNADDGYVIHDVPEGETEIQYVSTDCCNNQETVRTTITVADGTPPTPVTKQNIVVELSWNSGATSPWQDVEAGVAKLFAVDVDNGSYDQCTDVEVYIRRSPVCFDEDAEWGDHVNFCCADLGGEEFVFIDVELGVLDKKGNLNTVWSTIRLEDKGGGAITCPPHLVIPCNVDFNDFRVTGPLPELFTTCDVMSVCIDTLQTWEDTEPDDKPDDEGPIEYLGIEVPAYNGSCGFGAIFREWSACDDSDVQIECEQWIVVEPVGEVFNENTIVFPDNIEVDCDGYDTGEPTWVEATCELVGYTVETDTFYFEPDACVKVVNRWAVINWCDYEPTDPDKNNVLDQMDNDGDGIPNEDDPCDYTDIEEDINGNECCDGIPCLVDEGPDGIAGTADDEFETFPDAYDTTVEDSGEVEGYFTGVQVIKVIDTERPTVTAPDSLCFAVTEDCLSKGVAISATGTDSGACSSAWLSWRVEVDFGNDWDVEHVYASNLPSTVNGEPNPYYIEKSGSGDEITIVLPDGRGPSKGYHRVVWNVNDGCGNEVSLTTYFSIEDKKAPTPYCKNLSTTVMTNGQVELWAVDFDQNSFDNCTDEDNLLFTFTNVPPPPRCDDQYDNNTDRPWYDGTFWFYDSELIEVDPDNNDCEITGFGEYSNGGYDANTGVFEEYMGGTSIHRWFPAFRSSGAIYTTEDVDANGFLQIPIYVWDGADPSCANLDFCLVNLRVIDNGGGAVSGRIVTEESETIRDVEAQLMTNMPEYPKYDMTDVDGRYAFDAHLDMDYELTGVKDGDDLNGVSTGDLLAIQRHILAINTLDSPYKLIAADINSDKKINGQDLVELRKLILGIYTEFPQNTSWKFVDASQQLTLADPWIYNESRTIQSLSTDMMDEDFIGVKIGDVNNTVELGIQQDGTSGRIVGFNFDDKTLNAGEQVEVTMSSDQSIYGFQFTMDMSNFEVVSVEGAGIDQKNIGLVNGSMTMSHGSMEEMNGELFTMTLIAKNSGTLSNMLSMNSDVTRSEVYVGENLEVVNLGIANNDAVFSLGQNEPNPFTDNTTINYMLPEASDASLTMYDVTGKVLRVIEMEGQRGENTVVVDRTGLTAGVIYYKLEAGSHTATKHMIVIE